jgi:hypothetical protein
MRHSRYLDEILSLDPVRDYKRIVQLDVCFEFPWDTTRSLELALFRDLRRAVHRALRQMNRIHVRARARKPVSCSGRRPEGGSGSVRFLSPRRPPRSRTELRRRRSYPRGYVPEELGPAPSSSSSRAA